MSWQRRLFSLGWGYAGWPAEATAPRLEDVRPTIGAKVMAAVQATAEKAATAVTALIKGEPLTEQVTARLRAAEARQTDLEGQVVGLALDELLDPGSITAKRERLEKDLAAARAETVRLRQAQKQAIQRDANKRSEAEIALLQEQLTKYEGYAAARTDAMRDLTEATRAAAEAARRFLAATSLMQQALPTGCSLPRGFVLGRDLGATTEAVAAKNAHVLGIVKSLAETTIRFKRCAIMTEAAQAAPPIDTGTVPTGTLSAEQQAALAAAQAAAAAIKPAPVSRDDALKKIEALKANKEWAAKYLGGDAAARKEMTDAVKAAYGTAEEDTGEVATRLAALQRFGFPDLNSEAGKDLLAAMSGKISVETRRAVEAKRAALMADKGFVQKYLDGDQEARRVFMTVNVLMAAQVERAA